MTYRDVIHFHYNWCVEIAYLRMKDIEFIVSTLVSDVYCYRRLTESTIEFSIVHQFKPDSTVSKRKVTEISVTLFHAGVNTQSMMVAPDQSTIQSNLNRNVVSEIPPNMDFNVDCNTLQKYVANIHVPFSVRQFKSID